MLRIELWEVNKDERAIDPNLWQLLNDLRRPDARLIYSRQRDAYFLHPLSCWADREPVDGCRPMRCLSRPG